MNEETQKIIQMWLETKDRYNKRVEYEEPHSNLAAHYRIRMKTFEEVLSILGYVITGIDPAGKPILLKKE